MTLSIAIIGMVIIAFLGIYSNRRPEMSLENWTVAGRKMGSLSMWFLQAGEIYTTSAFLGLSGLAFTGGVAGLYSIAYTPLAYLIMYFMGPRVWRLAKQNGYLTQADFFEERYKSSVLGVIVAVIGVVVLIPYLTLQVSGLGTIVQIATGNTTSSTMSMIIAFALTVIFVMWSGLKGIAAASYFKDIIMVVVVVFLGIYIPVHFTGSIGDLFQEIATKFPDKLSIHSGTYSPLWFISSVAISITGGLMTLQNSWPALMSAKNEETIRKNYIFLPLYQAALAFPLLVGFVGILVMSKQVNPNSILLQLTSLALPHWMLGITVVAGIAAAMVPASGLLVGMTSSISRNIIRTKSPGTSFLVTQISVIVLTGIALFGAIHSSTLLINLLLMTATGAAQLLPGIVAGVYLKSMRPRAVNLIIGILVGELIVVLLTFGGVKVLGGISPGITGLAGNIIVLTIIEGLSRRFGRSALPHLDSESQV